MKVNGTKGLAFIALGLLISCSQAVAGNGAEEKAPNQVLVVNTGDGTVSMVAFVPTP